MDYDVVVVGAGNAAMCSALAAEEVGAKVLVLEAATEDLGGGNTRYTAGAIRTVYNGVEDLRELMPDLTDAECAITDFGTYTEDQFFDDMFRVTEYRTDPELVEILVKNSFDTLKWMRGKGVRFAPIWGRQAFKVDGRFVFWGGLTVEAYGGGPGLCEALWEAGKKRGIEILFEARALDLITDGNQVQGVKIRHHGKVQEIKAKSVVLASGGFQANTEWRTRYLGPGWDLAKVRGTPYNVGDGIRMATDIGASTKGNMILQLLNLDEKNISCVLDNSLKKIGTYLTGNNIPILDETLIKKKCPKYIIILPYYYESALLAIIKKILPKGSNTSVLVPLPKPHFINIKN